MILATATMAGDLSGTGLIQTQPSLAVPEKVLLDLSYPSMPVRGVVDMMGRYAVPPSTAGIT
jgi:hypothetical protein